MTNEELVIRIRAGIDVADNMLQLYEQTKGFIHTIARKYRGYGEIEDLEQEGYLALYDAVDGYDPEQGNKFLTYAGYWIRQRIQRYIQGCCQSVKIPAHSHELIIKYRRLCEAFQKQLDREPVEREISYYLELSIKQVRQLRKDAEMANIGSLDEYVKGMEEDSITLADAIKSDVDIENEVAERLDRERLETLLWDCVDKLEPDLSDTIRKRFLHNMTLQEIGDECGVSRDAIKHKESKGLRTLRKSRYSRLLRPYYEDVRNHAMRGVGSKRFRETWTSATERVALERLEG